MQEYIIVAFVLQVYRNGKEKYIEKNYMAKYREYRQSRKQCASKTSDIETDIKVYDI